jgi:hypothetical protein
MTTAGNATAEPEDRELTDAGVRGVPGDPGVYVLLRYGRVVMIGGTPNLEVELAAHRNGERGSRTVRATHFRTQEMALSRVEGRREELLDAYRKSHNSNVPAGNKFQRARGPLLNRPVTAHAAPT